MLTGFHMYVVKRGLISLHISAS